MFTYLLTSYFAGLQSAGFVLLKHVFTTDEIMPPDTDTVTFAVYNSGHLCWTAAGLVGHHWTA